MLKCMVLILSALLCIFAVEDEPPCTGLYESIKCVHPACPQNTCLYKGDGKQCSSGEPGCVPQCVCDDQCYRGLDGQCYDVYECQWYGW